MFSKSFLLLCLASCGTSQVQEGAAALTGRGHPLRVDLTLTSQITPTANQCIIYVRESGTASSPQLGAFDWVSESVSSLCSRGQGQGDHLALFTFTDSAGDQILGHYETLTTLGADGSLSWHGTWAFTSGTGRYAGISGDGAVPDGGIPSLSSTAPFQCAFDGHYSLP